MYRKDDFHIVLPSSDNNSSYFFLWKKWFNLDPDYNWHVAMTEMIYNISLLNVVRNFEFNYTKSDAYLSKDLNYKVILHYNQKTNTLIKRFLTENPYVFNKCELQFDVADERLHISSDRRFKIEYIDTFNSECAGFGFNINIESYRENERWIVKAPNIIRRICRPYVGTFHVVFWDVKLTHMEKDFSSLSQLNDINDLITYIKDNFADIFQDFEIRNGRTYMKLYPHIRDIIFCNEFKLVFGFDFINMSKNYYDDKMTIETNGLYEPDLHKAGLNIYVYASICKPIRFGDDMKQLIKCFKADLREDKTTCRKTCVIKNPMYIPINSSSFKTMSIEIKDENDKLVKFITDTQTVITLHFKKL